MELPSGRYFEKKHQSLNKVSIRHASVKLKEHHNIASSRKSVRNLLLPNKENTERRLLGDISLPQIKTATANGDRNYPVGASLTNRQLNSLSHGNLMDEYAVSMSGGRTTNARASVALLNAKNMQKSSMMRNGTNNVAHEYFGN